MTEAETRPWPALSLAEATRRLTAPGAPFEMVETAIRGIPTRTWRHAPPTLRDVFLAGRRHGDRTFLVLERERASFEGFARAAIAIAHALRARGVERGDRVAIAMRNLPEWPAAYFGALLAGAIATPLNAWWTGPELEFALNDSGAAIAIVDRERATRLAPHLDACPGLRRVLVARGAPAHRRTASLDAVIGAVAAWGTLPDLPLPDIPLDPDDPATLFYTSGTTGRPKGARGTHRNAAIAVMAHPYSLARTLLRRGDPLARPSPHAAQRATLLAIPLFHVTGCHAILTTALHHGTKLVLMRRWDVDEAARLIEAEACTSAGGVPTIAWQLLDHDGARDLSSLDTVTYGGAPAPAELVRRLARAFPSAAPATGWGMTETSATFTHHCGEDYLRHPESCGPPLPVCDARIVRAEGVDVHPGEVGELWARGPNVVAGYWNRPEADAATFVDGWLRTGDLARMDADGFVTIVDRAKDMLIRGGENIHCIEVESVLVEHPDVNDAALVGLPHPTLGEVPGAVIVSRPGAALDADAVLAFAAARLAPYKVPVRIIVTPAPLPRNPNGKVVKAALRGLFA